MKITGNADESFKQSILNLPNFNDGTDRSPFGDSIIQGLVVAYASVEKRADEPLKTEGKILCELMVTEDMLNGRGNFHGGCSAYLIDMWFPRVLHVSLNGLRCAYLASTSVAEGTQTMVKTYTYKGRKSGEKLRIINTTMTIGRRTMTNRTEIWSATMYRLAASGVHIKTAPSSYPKLWNGPYPNFSSSEAIDESTTVTHEIEGEDQDRKVANSISRPFQDEAQDIYEQS
ncbi:hypothetical protein K438DRAFT_1753579 [Mycena galopus ATCC 62051]|nr:hypothetical protein K438DRAFT_1753579 [Mycena galopus ATCC 62051]